MDIVERLRHTEEHTATIGKELVYLQVPVNPDGPEAADEIERLRLDMALTREALEKIKTLLGKNIHIKERAKEARSILLDILYPDRHDDK